MYMEKGGYIWGSLLSAVSARYWNVSSADTGDEKYVVTDICKSKWLLSYLC